MSAHHQAAGQGLCLTLGRWSPTSLGKPFTGCCIKNKIKAKKSNKTAGERELTDPLRDNNEVDPEEDENMIIGFNHLLPFDVDARREHRGTFTKEPVVYYPCVFPIEVYETATA